MAGRKNPQAPNHYNDRSTISISKTSISDISIQESFSTQYTSDISQNDTIQIYIYIHILRIHKTHTHIYIYTTIAKGCLISLPVLSTRRTRTTLHSFFTKSHTGPVQLATRQRCIDFCSLPSLYGCFQK